MENEYSYETKLYTSIGEFTSPFSYEETIEKIQEGHGLLILKRYVLGNKTVENNGEMSQIAVNTEITVRLNTKETPILCYEEFKMKEIIKPKIEDKTEKNIKTKK